MSCAPTKKGKRSYTCLPRESLLKIVKDYNSKHKDKIKMSKNNKVLWKRIKEKLSKQCDTEWCWIDQDFVSKAKHDQAFGRDFASMGWQNVIPPRPTRPTTTTKLQSNFCLKSIARLTTWDHFVVRGPLG